MASKNEEKKKKEEEKHVVHPREQPNIWNRREMHPVECFDAAVFSTDSVAFAKSLALPIHMNPSTILQDLTI
ncbi:hypothetical protein EAG_16268 [Camponotus floridanus]|uniref:Uncharacterized protein n=1 Tax=Camponotus floridanus TaxID=104421 RepID=E2AG95_CAMFO|nr:hypothetical protein EAG_16268 [Camponotus floridanus]